MNQCIISVVEKSVFVAFNEIVTKGSIEVWKTNVNDKVMYRKEIINTNFENLDLNLNKGKYKFEIQIDGQFIIKTIII